MLIFWRKKREKLTNFVQQLGELININTVEFQNTVFKI